MGARLQKLQETHNISDESVCFVNWFYSKSCQSDKSFYRGCRSKNLYYMSKTMTEDEIDTLNLTDVKNRLLINNG